MPHTAGPTRGKHRSRGAAAPGAAACPDPALSGARARQTCAPELFDLVRSLGAWFWLQNPDVMPPHPIATKFDLLFSGDLPLAAATAIDLITFQVPKGEVGMVQLIGRDYRFQNLLPDVNPPTWDLLLNGSKVAASTTVLCTNPFFERNAECIPTSEMDPCPIWLSSNDVLVQRVTGAAGEPGGRSVNARLRGWTMPSEHFAQACAISESTMRGAMARAAQNGGGSAGKR